MENFVENVLRKIEEIQKFVELKQKLIEHYKQEKQKQGYIAERNQKEKEYLR